MLNSMAPASVLIINLILNWESIREYGFREKMQDEKKRVPVRFNCFVLAAASTVLSVVCAVLYKSALMKDDRTYIILIAAAAAGALALILARVMGKEIPNLLLCAHAVG